MASTLSAVPAAKRKQLAATLGLFAVLFVAVGAVGSTGAVTTAIKVFVAVAFFVALVLALMAWGVAASIRNDAVARADRELDDAITATVAGSGRSMCDCGHEHDPDELHITDAEPPTGGCEHDGRGVACTHTCDTCVLAGAAAASRPAPGQRRPSPHTSRPS